MAIKILGLHHANVHMQRHEQALDFYGRILGLERDPALPFNPDRPNYWWHLGDQGTQIHSPAFSGNGQGPNANHFALMVEDIEEAKRVFTEEGIQFREQQAPGRALQIFVQDPAGNTLEFFQPPVWQDR
ncbi:MAG: VOC family protein [Chloroflexi bacterium]|nr:VOC family protein [Chloroflexota bacterium]